jgi:2-amino-4-hydroxy-6-hydroxymethyldihydropteridine diphosphokinase
MRWEIIRPWDARTHARQVLALIAHVALGSNLGDREALLAFALRELDATPGVEVLALSRIYETEAVGTSPQPRYLNAVVRIEVASSARELLDRLLAIELAAGRNRGDEVARWQSRTLDLDLLIFGDDVIDEPGLSVPHPRLHERGFVLEPLCDVSPDLVHPRLGKPIAALAEAVHDPQAVRRQPGALTWRND